MFDKNQRAFGLFKLGDARSALQELDYTHPASRGYHWYLLAARCHLSLGNLPHAYHLLSSIPSWEYQYATLIFFGKWLEAQSRYSEAAHAYVKAFHLKSIPAVLWSISKCCDRLSQSPQAVLDIYCQVKKWQYSPTIVKKMQECFHRLGRTQEERVLRVMADEETAFVSYQLRDFFSQDPRRVLSLLVLVEQYQFSLSPALCELLPYYQSKNIEQYRAHIDNWMRDFLYRLHLQKNETLKRSFVGSLIEFRLIEKLFGFTPASSLDKVIDQLELVVGVDFGRNAAHAHRWKLGHPMLVRVSQQRLKPYKAGLFDRDAVEVVKRRECSDAEAKTIQALDLAARPCR